MKTVTVEWRHLDTEGKTCARCAETGQGIAELLQGLREECRAKGVEIVFKETRLSAAEIAQSNLILINGVPLESVLPMASAAESPCCSCGEITGRKESCRTIIRNGQIHEAIPNALIREAICRVAQCC